MRHKLKTNEDKYSILCHLRHKFINYYIKKNYGYIVHIYVWDFL